jgi:hypothetical protein
LSTVLALFLAFAAFTPVPVSAQTPAAPADPAAQAPAAAAADAQPPAAAVDDDGKLRPAEPDQVTINLPTTLPLPRHAMNSI